MDIDEVIKTAVKNGKALEINSYYLRLDLNEENAIKAKKAGSLFAINTDSHRENNLFMIRLGVDIARKAGIEKSDVINTFGLEGIKEWKKKR
jgi:DNA polymerase (family 10)